MEPYGVWGEPGGTLLSYVVGGFDLAQIQDAGSGWAR
jgi:hypothetical protein